MFENILFIIIFICFLMVIAIVFLRTLSDNIIKRLVESRLAMFTPKNFDEKNSVQKNKFESSYLRSNRYKAVSFMDAISNEIMTIRSDLTNIKIKQARLEEKDDINLLNTESDIHHMLNENVSPCFIYKWAMAYNYKSSYLCARYDIKETKKQGYIIVVFDADNDFLFKDHFYDEYDSEKLKMLNDKHKIHDLKSGQNIKVYLWEPGFENLYLRDENNHWRDGKTAKILSITQTGHVYNDYPVSSLVILEMQMYQSKIIEVEMKWGQCIPDNYNLKQPSQITNQNL